MTTDERVKAILHRLIVARGNAGLSQSQVAKLLCYESAATISLCEAGQRRLDMVMFLRLCDIYDVSPVWALTGVNPDFDVQAWYEKMKTTHTSVNDLRRTADLLESCMYAGEKKGKS